MQPTESCNFCLIISEKWQNSAEGLDEPTISSKVSFGSEKILQMLLGSNALYVANLPVRVVTQQASLTHQTLSLLVPVGRINIVSADPKQRSNSMRLQFLLLLTCFKSSFRTPNELSTFLRLLNSIG